MKNKFRIHYYYAMTALIVLLAVSCTKEKDGTVNDVDGNVYKTITIGGNIWMAENLRTTKFRDGSPIQLVTDNGQWPGLSTAAYCWPENNSSNKNTLGGLYNGYAVIDSKGLCPAGWHISTDAEWQEMEVFLGLPQAMANTVGDRGEAENVGGHLKATSTWDSPNSGADNSSGFSAFGTGVRRPPGDFEYWRQWTGYYTATISNPDFLWMRYIGYNMQAIARVERSFHYGYSIRCVKD